MPYIDTVYDSEPPFDQGLLACCVSPVPKHYTSPCWSPAQFGANARHSTYAKTVNLYAPLTLRFDPALWADPWLAHGRPCPQVWSGGRLTARRDAQDMRCLPYARVSLGQSIGLGLNRRHSALHAHTSYRVRHRRLELWTSSQPATRAVSRERLRRHQGDTSMPLNARKVEDETSYMFYPQAHPWKQRERRVSIERVSSFLTRRPAPSGSNHEALRALDSNLGQ